MILALVAGVTSVALPRGETLWHLAAAPEEDGGWTFATIDGVNVREDRYSIAIRWGKITGFHDGCNSCGFEDQRPSGAPGRRLMCTLVACPPGEHDRLFARFAYGDPEMRAERNRLTLTLPGHRAELLRRQAR